MMISNQELIAYNKILKKSIFRLEEELKRDKLTHETERKYLLYFWNETKYFTQLVHERENQHKMLTHEVILILDACKQSKLKIFSTAQSLEERDEKIMSLQKEIEELLKARSKFKIKEKITARMLLNLKKELDECMRESKQKQKQFDRLQALVAPLLTNLLTATERQYFLSGDKAVYTSLQQRMRARLSLTNEKQVISKLTQEKGSNFLSTGLDLKKETFIKFKTLAVSRDD